MKLESIYSEMTNKTLLDTIDKMYQSYNGLKIIYFGKSLLSRPIPAICIGSGERGILYVGAHHGSEWITANLLMRFISDFCEVREYSGRAYGVDLEFLLSTRTYYIIPMLNPDGVELAVNGFDPSSPLADRQLKMNRGSNDFTHWQANARGVDLNHNYNAGFSEYKEIENRFGIEAGATKYSGNYPESEPETAALCAFIRTVGDFSCVLSLHTQGEVIYYTSGGYSPPRSKAIGSAISRMCGYELSEPEYSASMGGLTDWYIREFDKPAFTIECGRGENPLPLSELDTIYLSLRRLLFTSPVIC